MVMSVMSSVYIRFHFIRPCWSTLVLLNKYRSQKSHSHCDVILSVMSSVYTTFIHMSLLVLTNMRCSNRLSDNAHRSGLNILPAIEKIRSTGADDAGTDR